MTLKPRFNVEQNLNNRPEYIGRNKSTGQVVSKQQRNVSANFYRNYLCSKNDKYAPEKPIILIPRRLLYIAIVGRNLAAYFAVKERLFKETVHDELGLQSGGGGGGEGGVQKIFLV